MARARATGEGTIYRRKDGRWEAAIKVPTTAGTRKRVRVYAATRAGADEKLTELKRQVHQGVPIPDKTWKLGDYLDYWLENVVRPNRAPSTYAVDETVIRLYLKPGLGSIPLGRLSVPMIQSFLNKQLEAGKSASNVQKMRTVLSAAVTQAQREELVFRHVVRLVELTAAETREADPWVADEAIRFLKVARDEPLYPAYVLAILNGLRLGEILGLRWCDVDFDADIIHIRQQLQRISGTKGTIQRALKTKASKADLPLLSFAEQQLLAHQARQEAARAAAGTTWEGSGTAAELVFTTSSGLPIEPRNFSRSFQRACKRYNIRVITVHEGRHTLGSLLDTLGVSPRIAQLILRHARVTTTQEIYQHHRMDTLRGALEQVEQLLITNVSGGRACTQGELDRTSGRQNWPSNANIDVENKTVFFGGATGTRTLGLFHAMPPEVRSVSRITAVKAAMKHRTCIMLLGVVAVNCSRQHFPLPPHTKVHRVLPKAASSTHAARCIPSRRAAGRGGARL